MPTNNYPNIGYKNVGRDFNFYQIVSVNTSTFGGGSTDGYQPDIVITFPTRNVTFISYGSTTNNTVEYSFNGNTVHGDLKPTTPSASLEFDNRTVTTVWFRLKAGSSGPVDIRIEAWAKE